ncbi:MAG: hypothetical protein ABFQ65_02285 [Nanoarchaeota archaeon]
MKLKKCKKCGKYTLRKKCACREAIVNRHREACKDGYETSDAHYKFVKVRDVKISK